jgi:hypothetical protein
VRENGFVDARNCFIALAARDTFHATIETLDQAIIENPGTRSPRDPDFIASTTLTRVYTTPNTMAQTNANAAYAATTLSLAAKSMGTAPLPFDV